MEIPRSQVCLHCSLTAIVFSLNVHTFPAVSALTLFYWVSRFTDLLYISKELCFETLLS